MKIALSSVCKVLPGAAFRARIPERRSQGSGVRVIQAKDIDDGRVSPSAVVTIDARDAPKSAMPVCAGDVIIQPRGRTYKAGTVNSDLEGAIAAAPLYTLRPSPQIDAGWLALFLNSPPTQSTLQALARGTFIPQVPRNAVEQLLIDVPDLATQRALVSLTKLAQRERALAEKIYETRIALIGALAHRSSNSQERLRTPGKSPV